MGSLIFRVRGIILLFLEGLHRTERATIFFNKRNHFFNDLITRSRNINWYIFVSSSNAKYLTALIGILAAIIAFLGVCYSKEKEKQLKNIELKYSKEKEERDLLTKKKEEMFLSAIEFRSALNELIYHVITPCLNNTDKSFQRFINYPMKKSDLADKKGKLRSFYHLYGIGSLEALDELRKTGEKMILDLENKLIGATTKDIELEEDFKDLDKWNDACLAVTKSINNRS